MITGSYKPDELATAAADVHAMAGSGRAMGQRVGAGIAEVTRVRDRSVVTRLRAGSPLKVLTPETPYVPACALAAPARIYLSSYGGGLVAGDRLDLDLVVGQDATAILSTQASTKVFKSHAGTGCSQSLRASVKRGGLLVVYPDPLTCFRGARFEQSQQFEISGDAGLLLVDWVTSGRIAMNERWQFDRYRSANTVTHDGTLALDDCLLLDPADGAMDASYRLGRFNCIAMVLIFGELLREMAGELLDAVGRERLAVGGDLITSISPHPLGAVLRVAGVSTQDVGDYLRKQLSGLERLLGEMPDARKW